MCFCCTNCNGITLSGKGPMTQLFVIFMLNVCVPFEYVQLSVTLLVPMELVLKMILVAAAMALRETSATNQVNTFS